MHCMLMDLLHGFEVLSITEEILFNSRNVSRLVQNNPIHFCFSGSIYKFILDFLKSTTSRATQCVSEREIIR